VRAHDLTLVSDAMTIASHFTSPHTCISAAYVEDTTHHIPSNPYTSPSSSCSCQLWVTGRHDTKGSALLRQRSVRRLGDWRELCRRLQGRRREPRPDTDWHCGQRMAQHCSGPMRPHASVQPLPLAISFPLFLLSLSPLPLSPPLHGSCLLSVPHCLPPSAPSALLPRMPCICFTSTSTRRHAAPKAGDCSSASRASPALGKPLPMSSAIMSWRWIAPGA